MATIHTEHCINDITAIVMPNGQMALVFEAVLPVAGELAPAEPDVGIPCPYVADHWMEGRGSVDMILCEYQDEIMISIEIWPGHPVARQLMEARPSRIDDDLLEAAYG